MHLDKFTKEFIAFLEEKGRSQSTVIAYAKDIQQLSEYLSQNIKGDDLKLITGDILEAYVEKLKESGEYTLKTISRKINSIKTFFKFLVIKDLIVSDPAVQVKHPEFKPQLPRVFSPLEYRALRDTASNNLRLYTMVELLLQIGIRIGELSRLKHKDIHLDTDNKYIFIEAFSSNSARKVDLNDRAIMALQNYINSLKPDQKKSDCYLFQTKSGKPVLIRNIRTAVNRAFKKSGIINATVNDIRNTFIVFQLENGLKLEKLSEIVGHQKPNTTERYIQLVQVRPKKTSLTIQPL